MPVENELVPLINKQIDADFPESIPEEDLRERLIFFINDLIQSDFQKLVAILYKVDVDESKLKNILRAEPGRDAAEVIATLIIERENQKIHSRKQYGGKK